MNNIIFNSPQGNPQDAPKIEFPCDYPVKIMGDASEGFVDFVIEVVQRHDALFSGKHTLKTSRNGRFHSVTVIIEATGEDQLSALHEELKSSGRVKMVI